MPLYSPLHVKFLETDRLWSRALETAFGKHAGDARYQPRGKGEPGTVLRTAYEARTAAQHAWHAEMDLGRSRVA